MKLQIQKTCSGVIDTSKERKRIKEAFVDRPYTQKMLDKLMDAIEAQDWESAYKQLESKWWNGRDKEYECPRLEFVGILDFDIKTVFGLDVHGSYADLVWAMHHYPENYEVSKVKRGKSASN
jgi:hypothetical protein